MYKRLPTVKCIKIWTDMTIFQISPCIFIFVKSDFYSLAANVFREC